MILIWICCPYNIETPLFCFVQGFTTKIKLFILSCNFNIKCMFPIFEALNRRYIALSQVNETSRDFIILAFEVDQCLSIKHNIAGIPVIVKRSITSFINLASSFPHEVLGKKINKFYLKIHFLAYSPAYLTLPFSLSYIVHVIHQSLRNFL